jgi:hypothetical protein
MRLLTPLLLLILPLVPSVAPAQSGGDLRAWVALRATHIGALTPMITPAMISRRLNSAQLGIRYGFRDEGGIRTQSIAGSGIFGIGMASSVAITAGVQDADCFDCSPAMLLGLGGDMRVYESSSAGSRSLSLAISGDVGYAQLKPQNESALALGVGAPVTITFGATPGGMRFAPFFTPVFGIGSTTVGCPLNIDCEESGTRWVLGGGIGVWDPTASISASLGINHVMLSGSKPVFGVNVQFGGR